MTRLHDTYSVMRSCSMKTRYGSEHAANAVAAQVFRDRGVSLRVYLCDEGCGGWHLTKRDAAVNPSFRPPRKSERQLAYERKKSRRPRRRR